MTMRTARTRKNPFGKIRSVSTRKHDAKADQTAQFKPRDFARHRHAKIDGGELATQIEADRPNLRMRRNFP